MVGPKNLEDPFGAVLAKDEKGYTQARFVYRRQADSYLLYSLGTNFLDDHGRGPERPGEKGRDIVWRGEKATH